MKYLSPIPKQFVDQNGLPLSDGKVHVYISGDTQYANVYQDADGNELMPNPARLDSNGAWVGFVTAGVPLDYVVEDKDGNVQFEYEKVVAGGGGGGSQVQSNWTESDTTSPAYIRNKPTIPAEQVNSDWSAQFGKAKILNKPITMPNATGGLSKTLDADDITNGYVEFKIYTGGSYTGPYTFMNPAFVLFGSISQIRYNSGSADNYIDTAEVGLYSDGIVSEHIPYYTHSHAELVTNSAKGWGVSGWWSLAKDKYLSVYVRLTLTSSATAGDEVFCYFTSGIFGSGIFEF